MAQILVVVSRRGRCRLRPHRSPEYRSPTPAASVSQVSSGTTIDDSDLMEFTPVSTGSFAFLLDGSDIGLSTNGEDIDGVCWLDDGTILFSTQGTVRRKGSSVAPGPECARAG